MTAGLGGALRELGARRPIELPVLVAVATATLLMLATLFALVMMSFDHCELEELADACLIFVPTTCLLALYVTWRCIRERRDPIEATSATLCGASIAGGANVPLLVLLIGLFTLTPPGHLITMLVVGCIAGMILGCPLGFIFGAACLRPIRFAAGRPASLDAFDEASRLSFGWLANLALVCAVLVTGGLLLFGGHDGGGLALLALCVAVVCLGLWASRAAAGRLRARQLWLELVAAGKCGDWALVPLRRVAGEGLESLPDLFQGQAVPTERLVLARKVPANDPGGAYRSSEHRLLPVAIVERP